MFRSWKSAVVFLSHFIMGSNVLAFLRSEMADKKYAIFLPYPPELRRDMAPGQYSTDAQQHTFLGFLACKKIEIWRFPKVTPHQ